MKRPLLSPNRASSNRSSPPSQRAAADARASEASRTSPEISAKGIVAPSFFAERRPPCRFWMPDFSTKKKNRHGGRRSGQQAGAYGPIRFKDPIDATRFP